MKTHKFFLSNNTIVTAEKNENDLWSVYTEKNSNRTYHITNVDQTSAHAKFLELARTHKVLFIQNW